MKKTKVKAYRDKFRRLNREDKMYVGRIVATVMAIVLFVTILLVTGIYLLAKHTHVFHQDRDHIKGETQFSEYVEKKEEAIDKADENEKAQDPPDEAVLLAHLVTAEVGDLSRESQIAVASVVLNRVESDLFPDTIYDVIYQEGQYEPVMNGAIEKELIESATESAYYVYQNGSQIPCDVLFQAEFVQGSGVWAFLDGEYFCYK